MKKKCQKFLTILQTRFAESDISDSSVLIAYYILLSLFPMAIAIGNILPFFKIDPTGILDYMNAVIPEAVLPVLDPAIRSLLTSSSSGLLSLGVIGAIWSASKGIGYLQSGMNKAYGIRDSGSFISKKLVSLLTILLMLALLMAFSLTFSFGQVVLEMLTPHMPWSVEDLKKFTELKWPVTLLFFFFILIIVYRATPDVKIRLRDTVPGAALGSIGLLLLVQGFTIYLRFTTRTFSSYGALGAFFVLMFWLNFSAMIVIAGAVLNASIGEYRFGKAKEKSEENNVDKLLEKTKNSLVSQAKHLFQKK